jgi:hypothetical protein
MSQGDALGFHVLPLRGKNASERRLGLEARPQRDWVKVPASVHALIITDPVLLEFRPCESVFICGSNVFEFLHTTSRASFQEIRRP